MHKIFITLILLSIGILGFSGYVIADNADIILWKLNFNTEEISLNTDATGLLISDTNNSKLTDSFVEIQTSSTPSIYLNNGLYASSTSLFDSAKFFNADGGGIVCAEFDNNGLLAPAGSGSACGSGGGGGGSSIGWTWNSINLLRMTTTTDDLLLGGVTTTTNAKLEVQGNLFVNGNASTTGYGNFNNVSTTDTLYVGGYASSTGGLFTQGNGHYGGNLTIDGNATTSKKIYTKQLIYQPDTDQNITASTTTILSSSSHVELIPDADYVMIATPSITKGEDGQILFLNNISSFTIDLQDDALLNGTDVVLGGAESTIRASSTMMLLYSEDIGGKWMVVSNPNSASFGANADLLEVRNETGSALAAGKAVYISGYNNGLNRPLIALADADASATMPAIGITATVISDGANGEIITFGNAQNIIDTSGTTINDGAWISGTAGEIVFTRPTTDLIQRIGTVARVNANNGVVIITGAGRTNDTPWNFISTNATTTNFETTSFRINSEDFTDLTGTNLENNAGSLGVVSAPTLTGTNISGIPAASILAGTFGTGSYTIDTNLTVGGFASSTTALNTQGTLHVGGASTFDGLLSGTGWDASWASAYNATTTLSGFTDDSTNWDLAVAHISESGASHTYLDQSVISGATPTFTGTNFTGIPAAGILAGTFGTGAYVFDNTVSGITTLTVATATSTSALNTQGTLHVGGASTFDGLISGAGVTLAQQNFWNGTSTWAGFGSEFDIYANASSTIGAKSYSDLLGAPSDVITAGTNLSWDGDTLNAAAGSGGNPFDQWLDTTSTPTFNSVTTTDTLYVGGFASSTGGLFTQGNIHAGGNLTVDGNSTTTGHIASLGGDSDEWNLGFTHISNDGSDHSFIDQSVVNGATPTFTATNIIGVPAASILAGTFGTGSYTIDTNLDIGGYASSTTQLNTQGTLHVGGASTMDGAITSLGAITGDSLTDGTATLTGGNLTVIGTIGASGDADLLTLAANTLTVAGEVVGTTISGFSLSDCDGAANAVTWDATGKVFGCNSIAGGNVSSLGDLTDVATTTATVGDVLVLQADGTYENAAQSGGGGGFSHWSTDASGYLTATSTSLLFAGSATTTGHFAADSTLYVKDSNVGIGTASPASRLDISGGNLSLGGGEIHTEITQTETKLQEVSASDFSGSQAFAGLGITSESGANQQAYLFTDGATSNIIFDVLASTDTGSTWKDLFVVTQEGMVGINSKNPKAHLHVASETTDADRGIISGQYNSGTSGAVIQFEKSRGTRASPSTVADGDTVGVFFARVRTNAYNEHAGFGFKVNGAVSNGVAPTDILFSTKSTDMSGISDGERMRITSGGNVGIGLSTPTSTLSISGDLAVWGGSSDVFTVDQLGNTTTTGRAYFGGNVGIGTATPDYSLTLGWGHNQHITDGSLCVENLGGTDCAGSTDGVVYADDYIEHSSPIPEEGLTAVLGMKNKEDGTLDHYTFPSVVSTTTEKGTTAGISLGSQIKYLIKAVQEMFVQVQMSLGWNQDNENRIVDLETENEALKVRISNLEKLIK